MIKNKIKKEFPAIAGQFRISFLLIVHCSFLIVNCFTVNCTAEVRYVSKDGSSIPPYTSWETASDSIQKAINISNDGDTIIVANGIYKETLVIDSALTLLGSSMDSTIIDGTGIVSMGEDSTLTIAVYAHFEMNNFTIYGYPGGLISAYPESNGMNIKNCTIENGWYGVGLWNGINQIENLLIRNVETGIVLGDLFNISQYNISNSTILISFRNGSGLVQVGGGSLNMQNNVILHTNGELSTEAGINLTFPGRTIIKNNLVVGFQWQQYDDSNILDSIFVINDVFGYTRQFNQFTNGAIYISNGDKRTIKNNIIFNTKSGIHVGNAPPLNPDYNLYWNLEQKYKGPVTGGDNEILANPMVMKDTIPTAEMKLDMHLQAFSPAIDAGDPDILDVDGSRSDIGMFGGPGGQKYTYQDLAPRNPQNLSAFYDDGVIKLNWNKNSEADLFRYRVYRDTVPNFIYDTTKIIAEISDTSFNDNLKSLNANSYYYKITAIDSSYNQSPASEEITVVITGLGEIPPQIVEDYNLMQNYPNPFNPTTKITYRIKEPGYVKLMVYNILGEIVEVLVNGYKEKGYYEAEFTSREVFRKDVESKIVKDRSDFHRMASGIYLYRIEVIGKGNIPVFSDMKKMMLVK
jgi:hypothetical protein